MKENKKKGFLRFLRGNHHLITRYIWVTKDKI